MKTGTAPAAPSITGVWKMQTEITNGILLGNRSKEWRMENGFRSGAIHRVVLRYEMKMRSDAIHRVVLRYEMKICSDAIHRVVV